jgi:hypothetical protein
MQFIMPPESLADDDAAVLRALADASAKVGEPFFSFFQPEYLAKELQRLGFCAVTHFGPEEAAATYLAGRTDGMRLPAYFRMIRSEVG